MCLSEPQAGSSLADIRTRAEPDGDSPSDRYRLFGNKMWISGGEHEITENIVHLVLAKIPGGPPGVKGISLFIVPEVSASAPTARSASATTSRSPGLNHKMGYRGTVNTLLNFGEGRFRPEGGAGAVGYLVGEPHRGLAYMFHMMNEARIGVGLGAVALGYAGYLESLDYARNRPQGRPVTVARIPRRRRCRSSSTPTCGACCWRRRPTSRAASRSACTAPGWSTSSTRPPEAGARARRTLLLEILTPIAKTWPSQWCLAANDLAIQVHGGYGYTRDYPVEQLYRDNRLNPIHEGTHGIQALDLLGRKVSMAGGRALELLGGRIAGSDRAGARPRAMPISPRWAAALEEAVARTVRTTRALYAAGDMERALANATVYLEAFGHVVVAWIWLEQALAAHGRPAAISTTASARPAATSSAANCRAPGAQFELLDSLDDTTLAMRDAWF